MGGAPTAHLLRAHRCRVAHLALQDERKQAEVEVDQLVSQGAAALRLPAVRDPSVLRDQGVYVVCVCGGGAAGWKLEQRWCKNAAAQPSIANTYSQQREPAAKGKCQWQQERVEPEPAAAAAAAACLWLSTIWLRKMTA